MLRLARRARQPPRSAVLRSVTHLRTGVLRRACSGISYLPSVDGVPAPGAFSRATVHNGMVYVSGTGGASNDTASGAVQEMTAGAETWAALESVAAILRAAGSSPDRIVSATMLLSDKADYAACNEAYVRFFGLHGGPELPSRSTALWAVPTTAKVAFSCVAAGCRGEASGGATPVQAMRVDYQRSVLDERSCGDDPIRLFRQWFEAAAAARVPEPNAMVLSTVAPDTLQPSSRVVLLKGYDERGFVWYTNHGSRKARELAANPCAAINIVWLPLERQVRVEGHVTPLSADESRAYFRSRPRASQIGAWASRQSTPISSANELQRREAELTARFEGRDVPVPDFWGGYRLEPTLIEFWQGRTSRLHDRIVFRAAGPGIWARERLSP